MTAKNWRWILLALLVVYWLFLAVATHLPKAPELPLEQGDKFAHCGAYGVLTLLAALCWSAWKGPLKLQNLLGLLLAIALYAALDEITQPPFGRQADFFDWFADAVGILCGIAGYLLVSIVSRRRI